MICIYEAFNCCNEMDSLCYNCISCYWCHSALVTVLNHQHIPHIPKTLGQGSTTTTTTAITMVKIYSRMDRGIEDKCRKQYAHETRAKPNISLNDHLKRQKTTQTSVWSGEFNDFEMISCPNAPKTKENDIWRSWKVALFCFVWFMN